MNFPFAKGDLWMRGLPTGLQVVELVTAPDDAQYQVLKQREYKRKRKQMNAKKETDKAGRS